MPIALLHPAYLLIVACIGLIWFGPWRAVSRTQGILRSIVILSLAIGLARPVMVIDDQTVTRVWIVDGSASVRSVDLDRAIEDAVLQSTNESATRNVLIEIGNALEPRIAARFDRVIGVPDSGSQGESPLYAAILRASDEIPADSPGGIVIMSDGRATSADDGRALAHLRARGLPLNVLTIPAGDELRPVDLTWTGELRVGATARLTAVVAGSSTGGQLILESDIGELASVTIPIGTGRMEIPIAFEPASAGYQLARLRIAGSADQEPESALEIMLPIQEPRRVLYFGERQRDGAARLGDLLAGGFQIESAPTDPVDAQFAIETADLVILDDIAAESVPESVQRSVVEAVQSDGVGLVMSGGRSSFGAGGWHETPVETMLPVELLQKEEKRDPSTTLVIIIDTSGSMSGTRVQLAKEVARLAIRRLMPHDKVGIVEFYGAKRWAAPIQPASNAIEIERALNRLDAGGGTVILPAIEEAFYGMQNVDSRYKHVLVLTDGGVESGAFEPLLRRMAHEGINATTVLVGGGIHSEFLVNLANWGKGRFYSVPDRFSLPEIIFKQPSSAKLPSYREGTHAVKTRGGAGWWGVADGQTPPDISGYVEMRARPGAEVLLETAIGSHPIVSSWRFGLGRVTAIGTEPVGDGTQPWNAWPDYGAALARIFDRTGSEGRDAFDFVTTNVGPDIQVVARRLIPEREGLRPLLWSLDTEDQSSPILFEQRAPDQWVAKTPAPSVGEWLRLEAGDTRVQDARRRKLVARSSVVSERHVDPARAIDPRSVTRATGGRILQVGEVTVPAALDSVGYRARDFTSWLLTLAGLAFLSEILWRRRP